MTSSSELPHRLIACAIALATGLGFIGVMSLLLTDGRTADFLLDRNSTVFDYPFTIQNTMWLIFFGALGEVGARHRRAGVEALQLDKGLLPEDDETMLRLRDLGAIRTRVRGQEDFFLQRLVARFVLQFQSSQSTDRANALLNSSLDLMQHEVDTKYSPLRYLVWVIPTIGFIGTVVGIAAALNQAGADDDFQDPALLGELTRSLGVAFYTTMLALVQSAVLVLAQNVTQAREEGALNRAGQYCLDNLINRLYDGVKGPAMPVYRTPYGRIVEEKTHVAPRRGAPMPEANGTAPGGVPGTAAREPRGTGYTEPTVVRRPGRTRAGPAAPREDEPTRLAGAVPTDTAGSEEIDPVTGWLVVVSGPGVGRDLRVGVGRNDVGRDRGNRIALPFGDRKISRRAHLWVNYDPLNRGFSVAPENGTNLAYVDEAAIEERKPLPDRATISAGDTKPLFVAFCGDGFTWSDA